MKFQFNDGGRAEAGYKGSANDCVCRAIAIAAGLPYQDVYDRLSEGMATQRKTKGSSNQTGKRSARNGVDIGRKWFKDYMTGLGFEWVSTMAIGSGCTVHLTKEEMPIDSVMVVRVSKHLTSVINGVIHDTSDPSREGTRCVYGYWILTNATRKSKAA